MAEVEGKNKREVKMKTDRILRRWLDLPMRYRDPATSAHVVRKEGDS